MKIRYCQTKLFLFCPVAWGSGGTEGLKSCYDGPMEENCKYIIETEEEDEIDLKDVSDKIFGITWRLCPTCGRRF